MTRRQVLRAAGGAGAGITAAAIAARGDGLDTLAAAQDLPQFEGTELRALLIGGGAYDLLYNQLAEWEDATGAQIDTSTRLAHGELNDNLRREYASGRPSFNWSSDHTIFWPEWQIALEPLDDYVDAADLDDFTPSVLDACRGVDGALYALPRHVDAQLMYYRSDLFNDPDEQAAFADQYGYDLRPPTTWQEWADVAEFFTRPPDLFGFVFGGVGMFAPMTVSAGGQLLDEQNRPAWDSDAGRQALSHLVELYQVRETVPEGSLQYGWDDVTQLFRTGRVAFYFEWPGWYEQLKDPSQSDVAGMFDIASVPAGPAGPDALRTGQGSHTFTIARESDDKEASASAINWLTTPESEFYEFVEGGFLPVRTSVWERVQEYVAEEGDELDQKRLELLQQAVTDQFWALPTKDVPQWISVQDETLVPALQQALLGEVDVDEALEQSAAAAERLLEDLGALG